MHYTTSLLKDIKWSVTSPERPVTATIKGETGTQKTTEQLDNN